MTQTVVATDFRVWMIVSPPGEPVTIPVGTIAEAIAALNSLVALREHLGKRFNISWEDDVSGLEYQDFEGDWIEFRDLKGEDIEYYYSNYEELKNNPILHKPLVEIVER